MRVFQRVADEGGFAAAARALDLSPAVVTRLVADLEEHLGARLLQRTTRRVTLTEAGEAYLARLRDVLAGIDDAAAAATAHTQAAAGVLRVLTPSSLATHLLAPMLPGFLARYPQITLDITGESRRVWPVEDYDVTLLPADEHYDGNVVARRIGGTDVVLVATPAYLAERGVPERPGDLSQHALLRLSLADDRARPWQLSRADRDEPPVGVDLKPVLWANHTEMLLRAALVGTGIAAMPLNLVAPFLARGELRRVLNPWTVGHVALYAAMPSRKFMPQRTRVFLDHLRQHLDEQNALALAACARSGGCGDSPGQAIGPGVRARVTPAAAPPQPWLRPQDRVDDRPMVGRAE